jgi:hypothetical protein
MDESSYKSALPARIDAKYASAFGAKRISGLDRFANSALSTDAVDKVVHSLSAHALSRLPIKDFSIVINL